MRALAACLFAAAFAACSKIDAKPAEKKLNPPKRVQITPRPAETLQVTSAQAVSESPRFAWIRFSRPLDPAQDLRGVVRFSTGAFTARVEGGALKVFPEEAGSAFDLILEPALRARGGLRLDRRYETRVVFGSVNPQVRFTGGGVILPDNDVLSIPFEAVNARAVQVTAFRVYADDVGQFLQVNAINGDQELGRVGRFLWRKTIRVEPGPPDQWRRLALDAGDLLRGHRGALIRLTLSLDRASADVACSESAAREPAAAEEPPKSDDEPVAVKEASSWDYYEGEGMGGERLDRNDPCKDAYYQHAPGTRDSRNFLASDIGLIAKLDRKGGLRVAASSLRAALPLAKVSVSAHNFQGAVIGRGETGADGIARLELKGKPFYLTAKKDGDRGYLKVADGLALSMSHFDVGGQRVDEGLKGFLYGERGVWRPGDEMHLTLIVQDKDGRLPAGHPAVLRLHDPRGRLALTETNAEPVGGFYRFSVRTPEDAPTGLWTARVRVGGAEFVKEARVEAVIPNRLKLDLDFGRSSLKSSAEGQQISLAAQWLHGAKAGGLKADVTLKLTAEQTKFGRFTDHVFDDPARQLAAEPRVVFEGTLDADGRASFPLTDPAGPGAPGMLTAQFHARVFEEGGAFSSTRQTVPLHPYGRYIGVKLPKGDQARNMLLTDKTHEVSLVALDADGRPASARARVSIHQLGWKWWWDQSGESLAQFNAGTHADEVGAEEVAIKDGRGRWTFSVKYPSWGRYMVRACDADGGHCAGQIFYIDWPGWAGKAREQSGAGANALSFDTDKLEYSVGETARVRLPAAPGARALVSVENGTRVLSQRWVALSSEPATVSIALTKAMAPNIYVSAFLTQPHQGKANDRPIRLYGVQAIAVKDPTTELSPVIGAAAEWRPESRPEIAVSEGRGRAMTYTLAVVDEGLLGLTGFATPDPRGHFYRKEALGVSTWDLYDHVVGAYGGEIERLLSIGGSETLADAGEREASRRFPPVVRFYGPFELKAGEKKKHVVPLPPYVGAARVMVVAGSKSAFGRADKSIPVRQALMVQPTLPRVVGPGEEIVVPVSVFAEGGVKSASVSLDVEPPFAHAGPRVAQALFPKPGESLVFFKIKSGGRISSGKISVTAESGAEKARAETRLSVRAPNPATAKQVGAWIEPGSSWRTRVVPHGVPGTNELVLETSSLPPLNIESRLGELIRYPHGCLEQTTSTLFPQFFLPGLIKLSEAEKAEVDKNVKGGIDRLRGFQAGSGGFNYWPGGGENPHAFATSYVGHFLIEAERRGYSLPPEMRSRWERFQKDRALAWAPGGGEPAFEQAYRLYTLAVAGKPEMGAMNLLRGEASLTGLARWVLAGAYQAAGVQDASDDLANSADVNLPAVGYASSDFGSPLRDKALLLQILTLRREIERSVPVAKEVSGSLTSETWHHTQALAQSLMALARHYGESGGDRGFKYEVAAGEGPAQPVVSAEPIHRRKIWRFPDSGGDVVVRNTGPRRLYAAVVSRGVPPAGGETAHSSGLSLSAEFSSDPGTLRQGAQAAGKLIVKNTTPRRLDNLALTFIAPAGWEIHNTRWDGLAGKTSRLDYQDFRDDRVSSYFGLNPGERVEVPLTFTAAYAGRYYLPAVYAEAMYEASLNANTEGRWIVVERAR
jgi:alpha-2-macroglobulin